MQFFAYGKVGVRLRGATDVSTRGRQTEFGRPTGIVILGVPTMDGPQMMVLQGALVRRAMEVWRLLGLCLVE